MAALATDQAIPTDASRRAPRERRASPASEVAWLAAWGAVLLAITVAPYLVWLLWGPPDLERLGTFWFYRDFSQYLAAMREGAASTSWLIHDHFTAEPHQPILMYPLYVGLGKLAAALQVDALALYYLTELLSRAALIAAVYQFGALFTERVTARRLAFLISTFTLGLVGWVVPARLLLQAFGATGLLDHVPASINVYLEINTFGVFFSAPHLMLGLALTLLIPRFYLAIVARGATPTRLARLALLVLALALIHPFNLPVVLSFLGGHAALMAWQDHRLGAPLVAVATAGLVSTPALLYQVAVFQLDPFWSQTYGAQNLMPSPPPLNLLIDFGLALLLAPLGVWQLRRQPSKTTWLLLLWCGLGLVWMYVPVPFQRRFGFGLQPGLAVLAGVGILALHQRLHARPLARRWLNYGLLLLALNTTVLVYISLLWAAARNEPTKVYAWSRAEAEAARWLAQHSGPQDVVLAGTEAANTMVGVIPGRVVFGHIVATYQQREKEALMERFFSGAPPPEELERLLRQSSATYVFYGPNEQARGTPALDDLSSVEAVYDHNGVRIYRVRRP